MLFVSQKEKMFFTDHLSLMIKGGIPLAEALEVLKNEAKSRAFRKALKDILKGTLEGENLSKGLGRHPRIFNKFFQNIVKVGEGSGTLEENLKYLSSFLESEYSLRKKIVGALIYPLIIMGIALVVVLVITFFILPKLLNLFGALEVQLPLATRILLGTGSFLREYWFLILVGTVFLFSVYKILHHIKFTRFYFHKSTLFLPLFGKINQNRNLAVFSRTLYTLLKSGVPILDSLNICIETLPNEVYKKDLSSVRAGIERGEKISQGLKKSSKTFPSIFSQMVLVGERTGSLEESMLHLAKFYEGEIDTTVKNLSGTLEPVLLILVGLFVAFVAVAIITPIYQFTTGFHVR